MVTVAILQSQRHVLYLGLGLLSSKEVDSIHRKPLCCTIAVFDEAPIKSLAILRDLFHLGITKHEGLDRTTNAA